MRYTHYDETIKRWVVKSEEKADGETIGFCVKQEPKEISGINGDVVRLPLASVLVYGEAIDRLAELENAADVVEVVRCKDCKDYRQNPYNKEGEELLCMCWGDWIPTEPDDFCSHGERKEQE